MTLKCELRVTLQSLSHQTSTKVGIYFKFGNYPSVKVGSLREIESSIRGKTKRCVFFAENHQLQKAIKKGILIFLWKKSSMGGRIVEITGMKRTLRDFSTYSGSAVLELMSETESLAKVRLKIKFSAKPKNDATLEIEDSAARISDQSIPVDVSCQTISNATTQTRKMDHEIAVKSLIKEKPTDVQIIEKGSDIFDSLKHVGIQRFPLLASMAEELKVLQFMKTPAGREAEKSFLEDRRQRSLCLTNRVSTTSSHLEIEKRLRVYKPKLESPQPMYSYPYWFKMTERATDQLVRSDFEERNKLNKAVRFKALQKPKISHGIQTKTPMLVDAQTYVKPKSKSSHRETEFSARRSNHEELSAEEDYSISNNLTPPAQNSVSNDLSKIESSEIHSVTGSDRVSEVETEENSVSKDESKIPEIESGSEIASDDEHYNDEDFESEISDQSGLEIPSSSKRPVAGPQKSEEKGKKAEMKGENDEKSEPTPFLDLEVASTQSSTAKSVEDIEDDLSNLAISDGETVKSETEEATPKAEAPIPPPRPSLANMEARISKFLAGRSLQDPEQLVAPLSPHTDSVSSYFPTDIDAETE